MERITISISTEAKRALAELAESENRKVSEVVRDLLAEGVEQARRRKAYQQIADDMTPDVERYMLRACEELELMRGEEG
jgi:hypothetical protein